MNLITRRPITLFAVIILFLFACLLFGLNWYLFPQHYFDLIKLLGPELCLLMMTIFIGLVISFSYFLFSNTYYASLLFAVIAILEVSYGTILLHRVVNTQIHDYVQQLVNQTAGLVKAEVESELEFRTFALTRLSDAWKVSDVHPVQNEWEYDAQNIVDVFPGIMAVEWVDSEYNVRWVVPLEGNEQVLNMDARYDDKRAELLEYSKSNQQAVVSPPIDLIQGDRGFIIYLPVFAGDQFRGYVLGVIAYQTLFDELLPESLLPGYSISAYVGDEKVFERGELDPVLKQSWGKEVNVQLMNLPVKFLIWPDHDLVGQEGKAVSSMMVFVGTLMSLLVLMATTLVLLMQRYTHRIKEASVKLKQEMVERQQAEQAKAQMKQALLQSQKLEAVGTLAGGIAHNFNNILYSIKGYVQMTRDDVAKDSLAYRNLSKVLDATQCGQNLVSGIMSFSRSESYDFDVIRIKEVLTSSIDLLKATIPATVELQSQLEVDRVDVLGNHTQLQQVIMNIVQNAVDAMNQVGVIRITADWSVLNEKLHSECSGLTYPAYVVIRIEDNGVGMDEDTKDRIFEPFFTTKDVGKGTGLGLATSRSILEDHKGVIVVNSEVGKGSIFNIYIPKYQDKRENQHGEHPISR